MTLVSTRCESAAEQFFIVFNLNRLREVQILHSDQTVAAGRGPASVSSAKPVRFLCTDLRRNFGPAKENQDSLAGTLWLHRRWPEPCSFAWESNVFRPRAWGPGRIKFRQWVIVHYLKWVIQSIIFHCTPKWLHKEPVWATRKPLFASRHRRFFPFRSSLCSWAVAERAWKCSIDPTAAAYRRGAALEVTSRESAKMPRKISRECIPSESRSLTSDCLDLPKHRGSL